MFDPYRKWLGIPEQSRPPTHYQLLGIGADERDREVIETAVIRQSAYVRNFQNGPHADDATRLLTEIAAAKVCLLDPAKRAAYDAKLRPGLATPLAVSVQVPSGSLPRSTVVQAARTPVQTASSPAGSLGSAAVRPVAQPNPMAAGASGIAKSPVVKQPVLRPQDATARSAAPIPVSGAKSSDSGTTTMSELDRLLAADLQAPALNRRSRGLNRRQMTMLAAGIGVLLIIGYLLAGPGAPSNEAAKDTASPPPTVSTASQPPKPEVPRKQSAEAAKSDSVDLSLEHPAASAPASASRPAGGRPAGEISSGGGNVGLERTRNKLPATSRPDSVPDAAAAEGSSGPPNGEENPALIPKPAMNLPNQPGQFQPRLTLHEDETFGEIRQLEVPTAFFTALAFSESGEKLALGTHDGRVILWSMDSPYESKLFCEPHSAITALAFTPNDKMLLVALNGGPIRGFSLEDESHNAVVHFLEHSKGVRRIAFYNSGASVVSSGDDGTIRIWNLTDGNPITSFPGFKGSVTCLWVADDGSRLIASDGQTVRQIEAETKKPPKFSKILTPSQNPALSPDGRYLVLPTARGAFVRDAIHATEARSFPTTKTSLLARAWFSPNGQLLASTNFSDPGIVIWDFQHRAKVGLFEGHNMKLSDIAFSADGRLMASCSLDTTVRIWRLPDLATLRELAAQKNGKGTPLKADE